MADKLPDDVQQVDTKEYYANYPGFRITSGNKIQKGALKGKVVDLTIYTDNRQGIGFYEDGLHRLVVNGTSYETCGNDLDEKDYAKIISASNGHIMLDAQDGDVILKGRNIRLEAWDADSEITLDSNKHVYITGSITNIRGTNINVLATKDLTLGANFIELTGGVGVEAGTQSDMFQGNFLGKIFKWLDKFGDFL